MMQRWVETVDPQAAVFGLQQYAHRMKGREIQEVLLFASRAVESGTRSLIQWV